MLGREAEWAAAQSALDHASEGDGSLIAVIAEAGMGKTRLAEEVADEARRRGFQVAWARSWEGADSPAFWMWVQALRHLGQAFPEAASVEKGHPEFDLFDAVAKLVYQAAAGRPLLFALEDLHAADEPSVSLLRFVAQQRREAPIVLLVSWDETEARRNAELRRPLNDLAREATCLRLEPLSDTAVADLYERATGERPNDQIAAAIASVSAGNPFFVDETIRLLRSKGDLHRPDYSLGFRVPRAARDIVKTRLARLPDAAVEVLSVASVIGREFDLSLLQRVVELEADDVLELLEEPASDELIEVLSNLGQYRFTHIVVRETLYEDLTAARRMRLHRRVAEVLEETGPNDTADVSLLAHHWFKAAQAGDFRKAMTYAERAATLALEHQAVSEAVRLYRRALKAADSAGVAATERARIKEALEAADRSTSTSPGEKAAVDETATFVQEGDYWVVRFEGRTTRLRDRKGLRVLARLLENPGVEIHSLELAQASEETAVRPATGETDLDSDPFAGTGPVLDETAKRQYKKRIVELTEEQEEAESFNDPERAARARAEIEALMEQIAGAVGLGGRDRASGSPAERARISVSKTVKQALARIEDAHPELGQHLASTVKTGTFCSYAPDPRLPISWTTRRG